jgi:CBS domain-containing protein
MEGGLMKLSELCNNKVVTVTSEDTVFYACKLLRNEHVGCLVVVDLYEGNSKPIGIITDRDVVVKVIAPDVVINKVLVKDVIDSKFITANINDDPHTALVLMRKHGIRRIPIINDTGELEGIITIDDLFEYLSNELNQLTRAIFMEQKREKVIRQKIA